MNPLFDLVGVGLNATDTLLLVPKYPQHGGKVAFEREIVSPGGQVASALATCGKLGLRTKYIGAVGDDERGRIQMASLREAGLNDVSMNLDDVEIRPGCPNQSAYIVIDQSTGERTIFWHRPECLTIDPDHITPEKIACARMLHVDGHDTPAVARAARIARDHGIPVSVDVDNVYPGFERVLSCVDYVIGSAEFPERWTGERDPFRALEQIQNEYGMRVAAMTLGPHGALVREAGQFVYSPGFVVNCVDTTGAGDVFHGAFCYSVLKGASVREALEFSNAMAALNCTRLGARGGIATADQARDLIVHGERRSHPDFSDK